VARLTLGDNAEFNDCETVLGSNHGREKKFRPDLGPTQPPIQSGSTDIQTAMTKLRVAFGNFANAPKNYLRSKS
jgi:hypothetical protein